LIRPSSPFLANPGSGLARDTWALPPLPSGMILQRKPAVSVVLVSDYGSGGTRAWDDLRGTLAAVARQDYAGAVEVLLSESAEQAATIPPDLTSLLPSLRVVLSPSQSSYVLKNRGVAAASADIVAMLDADCRPLPDWLSRIMAAFERHPDASVISGRTTYQGTRAGERILALLSRSYLDPGRAGTTRFISNNNAGWKRSVFLAHPLPEDAGPFAARLQSEAVLRDGGRLLFDPGIHTIHEFEGWRMEADIRRNAGFGTVITRLRDRRIPYSGLVRLGRLSIGLIAMGKTWNSWRDCVRCWRVYCRHWTELPLAMAVAPLVIALEIPGMWAAFAGRKVSATAYR
jgi:glycosyltransferase involved in cell wall biosynthesis